MPQSHSTDDFNQLPFRAHGRLELQRVGNTIVYHAQGPFNLEAIVALSKARLAGLADWGPEARNAVIVEFETSMLMSTEALQAYSLGLRSHFKQGDPPLAVAWVVPPEVEGRHIMLPLFARIYAETEVPWKSFEDFDAAMNWIDQTVKQSSR